MKKFKAAIFDMDGTLLESMYIWRNLAPEYLKRNNIAVPDDLLERLAPMAIKKAVDFLIDAFHINLTPEAMYNELLEVLADFYRTSAVPKPGAREFLQKLHSNNIPTVIFSATPEHLLHLALDRWDMTRYFSHGLISCDMLPYRKNNPESFFAVARHLNTDPADVMIFEDAWYAASTASSAGFAVTAIADSVEPRTEDMRELAEFYVEKSWDEFPAERYFQLNN